jgi:quinol monooxygenase YgiN
LDATPTIVGGDPVMNLRRCHVCGRPFPAEIRAAICPRRDQAADRHAPIRLCGAILTAQWADTSAVEWPCLAHSPGPEAAAMPYLRLTMAHPRPERRAEVLQHYEELVAHVLTLPGCLAGYVLEAQDQSGEVGRMSLWEDADAAHHAANDPHAMALHAELHFDVQGSLWDRSFTVQQLHPATQSPRP